MNKKSDNDNYSNVEELIKKYQDEIERTKEEGGPYDPIKPCCNIIDLAEQYPGRFDHMIAYCYCTLGHIYRYYLRDYDQAIDYYKYANEIYRRLIEDGNDSFRTSLAESLECLSDLYLSSNDYYAAENELVKKLAIVRKMAEEDSINGRSYVQSVLESLADLHVQMEDYWSAEIELKEVMVIARKMAEEDTINGMPYVLRALDSMAALHSKMEDYDAAENELKEELDIARKMEDEDTKKGMPYVARALESMADLHYKQHNYASAKEEYQELKFIVQLLILHHPATTVSLVDICNRLSMIRIHTAENDEETSAPEYVDLGLSVKWATCNLCASRPENFGKFFQWGNPVPFSAEDVDEEETDQVEDTIDMADISGTKYDAARVNWGEGWRMPTMNEMDELLCKCKWDEVTINDKDCYKVTGRNETVFSSQAMGSATLQDVEG